MLALLILITTTSSLQASTQYLADGRTDKGPLTRIGIVMGRGALNFLGLPTEFFFSPAREVKQHPKAWPLTFIPKTVTNIIYRAASAGGDVIFFPWIVPFTDDLSPLTEAMGLSEYPWTPA